MKYSNYYTAFLKRARKLKTNKKLESLKGYILKKPYFIFFASLGALFFLIILGNILTWSSKTTPEPKTIIKSVSIQKLDSSPTITHQGTVEKTGVVKILAQTAGVVQSTNIKEGGQVYKGQMIVRLSSNYQGGSAPTIQTQIANTQYQNTLKTYSTQKEIISKQRELANKTKDNTEELRKISEESKKDTESLLTLNQDIVNTLNTNLTNLENNNQNGSNDAVILQTKQVKSQFQSIASQLNSTTRALNYQNNTDNPPTKLSEIQKDLTLKQLDLAENALEMQKEIGRLQVALASIGESLMYPSTPFNGVLERLYVREGQTVTPGTPIALVVQPDHKIIVRLNVPTSITKQINPNKESKIFVGSNIISAKPLYISENATDGQLHNVTYEIPIDYQQYVIDGQEVKIDLPMLTTNSDNNILIPLDSVYQTENEGFVYVLDDGRAKVREIRIGQVYGGYVSVLSGLKTDDTLILSRNVINNDMVNTE